MYYFFQAGRKIPERSLLAGRGWLLFSLPVEVFVKGDLFGEAQFFTAGFCP
jgi:hypothetical protein